MTKLVRVALAGAVTLLILPVAANAQQWNGDRNDNRVPMIGGGGGVNGLRVFDPPAVVYERGARPVVSFRLGGVAQADELLVSFDYTRQPTQCWVIQDDSRRKLRPGACRVMRRAVGQGGAQPVYMREADARKFFVAR